MNATIEYILYGIYLILGPMMWVGFGIALFKGRKRMLLLQREPIPAPSNPPRATILIPAKDEGERIRDCIESALHQDYPNFDVIAVDDRSTDRTGTVMDELAATHPRLRVVHIQEGTLPEGWTGKCNALHSAVGSAGGDWLLFVDSDVILEKNALSATLAYAQAKDCDMISLLPRLECHTFWESLIVPLAGCGLSTVYLVSLTNNNHLKQVAFANGQFILIRRRAYDAIGGHTCVRDRFCEDMELARVLKSSGYKIRISWAAELAAVRMYNSLSSIMRGWSRIFFAAGVGRPWRILMGIFFVIFCSFSAYVAIGWGGYRILHPADIFGGGYGWLSAGLIHLGLLSVFLSIMYTWSGNARRNALFFPLGGLMLLGIFIKSIQMCITGKVEWRGTRYTHRMTPREQL